MDLWNTSKHKNTHLLHLEACQSLIEDKMKKRNYLDS